MMHIIAERKIEGHTVLAIDTGMTARNFAQSKLSQSIASRGYIFHPSGMVEEWIPEGTFCDTEGPKETMLVYGPEFPGITLLSAVTGGDRELAWKFLYQSISLITRANLSGKTTPEFIASISDAGPESILCAEDGRVLVIPGEIYIRSIAGREQDAETANRLLWVHPDASALNPLRAFAFLAGTLAYRIASGNAPFSPAPGMQKSVEDGTTPEQIARNIRNGIFEPIELAAWTLRPAAASCINTLISAEVATSTDTLMAFGPDWASVLDPSKEGIPESRAFLNQKENATKKRSASVQRESFFRRYRRALRIGGIIFAFVAILAGTWFNDQRSRPTTAGLSSDEVVSGFYKAIATLNQEIPEAYTSKGVRTDYSAMTSNLFVTTKVRQTYEKDFSVITPAKLFALKGVPGKKTIYGMTRLSIQKEGENTHSAVYSISLYLWIPLSADKSESENLTKDPPAEKASAKEEIEVPVQLSVYRYKDSVTVELRKKRWLITSFKPEERTLVAANAEKTLGAIADGSAASEPWAPTDEEIRAELNGTGQTEAK